MADCCAMMRPCFPTILACNAKNFKGNLSIFCEGDQLEENIQYSRTIKFSRVVEDESHEVRDLQNFHEMLWRTFCSRTRSGTSAGGVSGRTPASATRATGTQTDLNVRERGGREVTGHHLILSIPVCEVGQWGQDCDRECLCSSGGESDPNTAAYTCSPGCLGAVCVAQALSAWTLQISAPVISMAR